MTRTILLLLVLVVVGCSSHSPTTSEPDAPPADAAPTTRTSRITWFVDHGQGDQQYMYGGGSTDGTTFTLDVTIPLPADATFGGVWSAGIAFEIDPAAVLPDGFVTDRAAFTAAVRGGTPEFGFIYRNGDAPAGSPAWLVGFPQGASCGKCVRSTGTFDSFTPVPCAEVQVVDGTPATLPAFCNYF